jgi:hypothetical protein
VLPPVTTFVVACNCQLVADTAQETVMVEG